MRLDEAAVLDACVLIPMPLADTLLRLAEAPALYRPRWTDEILLEMRRNLVAKIGLTERQAERREGTLRRYFSEALVENYGHLTDAMQNDLKDRHVLAAAAHGNSRYVVTFNLRDFPVAAAAPLGVEVLGPSAFLIGLFELEPEIVASKLREQAVTIDVSLTALLKALRSSVPGFIAHYCAAQQIEID